MIRVLSWQSPIEILSANHVSIANNFLNPFSFFPVAGSGVQYALQCESRQLPLRRVLLHAFRGFLRSCSVPVIGSIVRIR